MEILISSSGDERIQARFRRLEHNLTDTTAVFAQITTALAAANDRSWARGVKLAEATVERKAREGLPPQALVASGKLKASLTRPGKSAGAIRTILPGEMRFGTSIFYARFQNWGTASMPRHRVLKVTPTVRKLIKTLLSEHLLGGG